jgi:hypothetical protein
MTELLILSDRKDGWWLTAKATEYIVGNSGCTIRQQVVAAYPLTLYPIGPTRRQECLPSWTDEDFDFCPIVANRFLVALEVYQARARAKDDADIGGRAKSEGCVNRTWRPYERRPIILPRRLAPADCDRQAQVVIGPGCRVKIV